MSIIDRLRQSARAAFACAVHWWQFASIKLAVIAGLIAGLQATYPDQYAQIMGTVPEQWRPLVGLLVTGAAFWARTKPQPGIKPKGTPDA